MHLFRFTFMAPALTLAVLAADDAASRSPSAQLASVGRTARAKKGVWISREELAALPVSGPAWENLKSVADQPAGSPALRDQNDQVNVRVMAKALVYARTGEARYREEVIGHCIGAIGTENGGSCLGLGRNLAAFVIAADLVGLSRDKDQKFRKWLREKLTAVHEGRSLRSTHESRPNNWGTQAGGSRAAIARYLDDTRELTRVATVFKGWLGDHTAYAGFKFKDLGWQQDGARPVGVNPKGSSRDGHSLDGVLADDQRRGGPFQWPPPKENYVYEALQGALLQAVILHRSGFDVWNWEDKALLRAFKWLHEEAKFPAEGDDTWQPHVINHVYGAAFPAPVPARPGKNVGWTDWTLGTPKAAGRKTGTRKRGTRNAEGQEVLRGARSESGAL
jgi:hypothetical protein